MTVKAFFELWACTARLVAALATRNGEALWNVFCDVEDIHRGLGHTYNTLDRDRPWELPHD